MERGMKEIKKKAGKLEQRKKMEEEKIKTREKEIEREIERESRDGAGRSVLSVSPP